MFNMERYSLHRNGDRRGPPMLTMASQRSLQSSSWLACLIPTTFFGTMFFIIAVIIVLSLIPLYLNRRTEAAQDFISPLLNVTFALPENITLEKTRALLVLNQEALNNNQVILLDQILQDKINADSKLKNIRVNVSHAFITLSSIRSKRQISSIQRTSNTPRVGEEDIITIYQIDHDTESSDQLTIFFQLSCRRPCKRDLIPYIFRNTFHHLDINTTVYFLLFISQLTTSSTTTVALTNVSSVTTVSGQTDVPPDLKTSVITSNVKDNEITQVNGVSVYGNKDYSGNVESIYAIRTVNAIYTIDQDRIVQMQTDNETFIIKYNNVNNQFMMTLITDNSSYELPSSYGTPNITFPKPMFLLNPNEDIPNPYTGVVLELTDKATSRSITDATLLMYYYDEQLGNRSTVMKNVGGGFYYSLLPTNDTTLENYFSMKNLLSTVSQQSDALLKLIRAYPISDICSQIPQTAKIFCSLIIEDMTMNIPGSLNAVSKYIADVPVQSKPPGELLSFQVVVLVPGEQPVIISLDGSNAINTKRLAIRANSGYRINPNVLTAFSSRVGGSRGKCNEQTVAGNDVPDDRVIDLEKANSTIRFYYETYSIKDQIDVYYEKKLVFSSTCVGTDGELVVTILLDDNESSVRVNVIPDCAGENGTAWYYIIECESTLICSDGLCYCGVQKKQSVNTTQPTMNGCGADHSRLSPYINSKGDKLKFTQYCNTHDICYGTCNTPKATCDQQFLQSMNASCPVNWRNATDIQNCQKWADRFYSAVHYFGGGAFEDAQKRDCTCAEDVR